MVSDVQDSDPHSVLQTALPPPGRSVQPALRPPRWRWEEPELWRLSGVYRQLIKASYSVAGSFLTVPAAGSTTLCFLTASSPLFIWFLCFPLFLSPSPSVAPPVSFSLGPPPASRRLEQQMFDAAQTLM